MTEKRVVLKHKPQTALVGGHMRDVGAVHQNLAGRGCFKARHHPERCRFAAARGPKEGEKLTGFHLKVDVIDGRKLLVILDVEAADIFQCE